MNILNKYLHKMYVDAYQSAEKDFEKLMSLCSPVNVMLDVGCWDGKKSVRWQELTGVSSVWGMELTPSAAAKARKLLDKVISKPADLSNWGFGRESVDLIVSNQVVEHLTDLDIFFSECSKVLKKEGYLLISTNNLSSWHNIFALALGMAPFDLSNSSKKAMGLGNTLAIHKKEVDPRGKSWTHKCIYTATWLSDWAELYGMKTQQVLTSGYYPFPNVLARIDKTHSAFISMLFRKI